MLAAKREALCRLVIAAGLFILAGVIRQVDPTHLPLLSAVCFLATSFIYIGLTFAWGVSISRRILHREVRRQLLLGCAMAVLWLLLRTVKYRFPRENAITRHLWYLYYVPQILAPLFSFYAALQLGRREDTALCAKWYLLLIPAAVLIAGMLTNDLHQFAFRFSPDWANWNSDYSHGPLYFLVMVWILCFLMVSMGVIYRKCRISEIRRYAWIPPSVFIVGMILCILSFLNLYTFHKMPECFCLTFIALWESCLQVGLLPTNNRYLCFFSEASVEAQIADRDGRILYRAKNAPQLTPEQMRAADRGAILLNADARLQSAPVHDGHVYWVEDLAQVNRIKGQLEEIHAQLAEENELIRAEAELKRQRAEIEEKTRLADHIAGILRPRLNRMNEILSRAQRQDLQLVCILGAYVKRRGNLALICDKDASVPVEELAHCIRESLNCLDACGVVCACHQDGKGSVRGACLQTAYDFFEDCLEAALPSLSALMVRVECSGRFSIRLMMEDAAGLPDLERYAAAGQLTMDPADGELCVTLTLDEGGEGA